MTATDTYGKTSMQATAAFVISAAVVTTGQTINITSTWLQQNGPGPYVLNRANTTYVLQTDVTTSGTAFVFANRYVTLNLNGHTITYNNATPMTVPNGNFGADPIGSHTVKGWNLTGAPNSQFTVEADNAYLLTPQVLNWSVASGTTPQVITSQNIAIPQANQSYTASVSFSNVGSIGYGTVMLQVFDSVTNQLVANWQRLDSTSGGQADCPNVSFFPTTTDPVYLKITLTPTTTPVSVVLGRVVIGQSMDYGILASPIYQTNLSTSWGFTARGGQLGIENAIQNLPVAAQNVYQNVYGATIEDTLGTGEIVQGQSGGAYCDAIMCSDDAGPIVIKGVNIYVWGDDTTAISARNTQSTIQNCTVTYSDGSTNRVPISMVRAKVIPAIDVRGNCPALVKNCTIANNPQMGIMAGSTSPRNIQIIQDNTLHPNVSITNGYALAVSSNVQLLNNAVNTLTSGSSRGIAVLDGPNCNDVITGNTIIVRENPNREYGNSGTTSRAFAMRDYPGNALSGTVACSTGSANVTGTGTSFTTQVTVGEVIYFSNDPSKTPYQVQSITSDTSMTLTAAVAAVASGTGQTATPLNPDINIQVSKNYFEAITGAGLMQGAIAGRIVLVQNGSSGITFNNNTFKAICIGSTDPGPAYYARALEIDDCEVTSGVGLTFTNNTFESDEKAIALGGPAVNSTNPINNVLFLNSTITQTTDRTAVARTFDSYYFGDNGQSVSGIQVIGSTYHNRAPNTITWTSNGQKSVTVGWVLTTQVLDANGNPLQGATVNLLAANGTVVGTGTTDSNGNLVLDVGTIQYSGTTDPTSSSIGPTSMTVSMPGYSSVSTSVSLTANQTITVKL